MRQRQRVKDLVEERNDYMRKMGEYAVKCEELKTELVKEREAVASLLESLLMRTGNYNGFNYIEWLEGGVERWYGDGKPKDVEPYLGDQSRRIYH